jgi:magnesium chelatase family protein
VVFGQSAGYGKKATQRCPCGYYGDPVKECTCSPTLITRYRKRISGPLLDRIDNHVEVPRVEYEKLTDDRLGKPSANVRTRAEKAREMQQERFSGARGGSMGTMPLLCNAEMPALAAQAHVWARRRCASSAG